jgi:hypothetical protein
MKKMKAVAGEIITTETATEIKEGQKSLSFLPSFLLSFLLIQFSMLPLGVKFFRPFHL